MAIACDLYRRLWRIPEASLLDGYPAMPRAIDILADLEAKFSDPASGFREKLGPVWPVRATALCADLRDPPEEGIGNRDTHMWNIVSARREPWLVLDPKPCWAERAYDGGYFLFEQHLHGPLSGSELTRAVAEGLGVDVERLRAWAVLRGIESACGQSNPKD